MQALYWNYFKDSTEKHMSASLPRACAQQRVKQSVLFVRLFFFCCVLVRATRKHNESFEKLAPLCFETLNFYKIHERCKTAFLLPTPISRILSLAGQPLHKSGEEGSGVMPMCELYLLQPRVQPNQIAPCHHQYQGAVPNARADQSVGLGSSTTCTGDAKGRVLTSLRIRKKDHITVAVLAPPSY